VVGILVLGGLGAVALPNFEENEHKQITLKFSTPIIETENNFISLDFDETNSYYLEDDKPMLPSYTQSFSFPFGTKIKSVKCLLSDFQDKILDKHIMPTPICSAVSRNILTNTCEKDQIDYGLEPYPKSHYNYNIACGRNRDGLNVFVNVEVIPVIYHPQEKRIEWANNGKIIIEYEIPTNPIKFDDEYKFIILAPSEFGDELAPLVTHKINRGISTIFVSLNDIYNGVYFPTEGRDEQEEIKYFIKDAIENWGTSYVLLVGGSSKFPVRISHIYVWNTDDIMEFVSDLYYADVYNETGDFCDWDSNENDVFGEFDWGDDHNYDEVDLYPDVYLGRLACVNSNEVETCVDKIITYENNAAYSQQWFKDIVVIGGDTWCTETSGIAEGEYINQKILDLLDDFSPNKVWDTNGKLGSWSPPYGTGHITNAINDGCGVLHWSGHGNLDVWATHRFEGSEGVWIPTLLTFYPASFIRGLSNGNKLPLTIIGACLVGKFNQDPDCFTWSHMLNSNGGSIAAMSATESLYSTSGTATAIRSGGLMEISSIKSYSDEGALTFGEMWAWALQLYCDKRNPKLNRNYRYDYVTVEEWQAFGDPTLAIGPQSQPPEKPDTPSGPTEGVPNTEYTFFSSTTDPDGDDIQYLFDWGDGTDSGWLGPFESGEQVTEKHTWTTRNTFDIKVRAKDIHEDQSEWSDPLKINIPRTKDTYDLIFSDFLNYLENLFPLLKITFRLLLS
jgi:hypothetical protein